MRIFLFLLSIIISTHVFAELQNTQDDNKALYRNRKNEIKSWSDFNGVWVGTLRHTSSPSWAPEWLKIDIHASIYVDGYKVKFRGITPNGEFQIEDGDGYGANINNITYVTNINRADLVWSENWSFAINRISENVAMVCTMRTVNNWLYKDDDQKRTFADSSCGKFSRKMGGD